MKTVLQMGLKTHFDSKGSYLACYNLTDVYISSRRIGYRISKTDVMQHLCD